MTTGRKRAAGAPKEQELELLKALKFVSVAQYRPGDAAAQADYQQHCVFAGGSVVAFNGVIAAGYPIGDEMDACPNTHLFVRALEKVRGAYSLAVLNNQQLAVKTDKLRVLVPCVPQYNVIGVQPDPPLYACGDEIKDAAKAAGIFSTDGAQTVLQASIITSDYSFYGSNNAVIVEAFHGWHMPPGLLLPVSFFDTVAKVPEKVVNFGFTPDKSFTIYFENGAWLRTQVYLEPVPDLGKVLKPLDMSRCTKFPTGFWEACEAVALHSVKREVYFDQTRVMSHDTDTQGAQHQLEVPFRKLLSYDMIRKFQNHCDKVDFITHDDKVVFGGEKVRGVVMVKKWN